MAMYEADQRTPRRIRWGRRTGLFGLAVLAMLGFEGATQVRAAEPVNAILPTAGGCLVVAFAGAGNVDAACPAGALLRPDDGAPDGSPAALAERADGRLLLGTTTGLYAAARVGAPWTRLTDVSVAWVGCAGARCVVRPWGAMPAWVTADALEPVPTDGLPDRPLNALHLDDVGGLVAGIHGMGVFVLRPGETAWASLPDGLNNAGVLSVAGRTDGALFAGTHGGGLYRWPAGGAAWQPVEAVGEAVVTGVAADDATDRVIAAGYDGGVWTSADGGASWRAAAIADAGASWRTATFGPDGAAWIGGTDGALFTGWGNAWRAVPSGDVFAVSAVSVAPSGTGNTAVVRAGGRLFIGPADGTAWRQVSPPVEADDITPRLAIRGDGTILYGGPGLGLHASRDGGRTWTDAAAGLPGSPEAGVRALWRDPDGGVFAVAADQGHTSMTVPQETYRSEDYRPPDARLYGKEGATWRPVSARGDDPDGYAVQAIAGLPDGEAVAWGVYGIVTSSSGRRLWQTHHMAQSSWAPPSLDSRGNLWTERQVSALVLPRGATEWDSGEAPPPSHLFWGFVPLGESLWAARTRDGGLGIVAAQASGGFRVVARPKPPTDPTTLGVTPDGALLVGTESGLFRSDDRGASWRDITPLP